jgi:hypothetical protein
MVTNNKTFLFLFFSGLVCIFIAGLSLFISLNPNIFKDKIQYEVGTVEGFNGSVDRLQGEDSWAVSIGQALYSKEEFKVEPGGSISLQLAKENIKILGPAQFEIQVISPEKAQVFINFSKYTNVEPKDGFEQIKLTFDGWLIEPYFSAEDLGSNNTRELNLPAISNEDTEGSQDTSEMKESMLDELIGAKRDLLKRCYENYLRKNPMATGKLVVEFSLQNSGRVSSSRIKDSSFFKDETFKNCVQDVFTRIKTTPFSGDSILVTYPIEFE